MRILFDESTLKLSANASRSITAVMYLDFGGFFFPDERWSDFAVVITTWWLQALERLQRGIEREVMLRFMDGPCWMTVVRQDEGLVMVRCTEDRRGSGLVHEERVALSELTAEVQRFGGQLASACARRGIETADVAELRSYLEATQGGES